MNNKGAIFSGYMYVLLVGFLLSLSTLLVVLNNTRKISEKAREGAENLSDSDTLEISIDLLGDTTMCVNKYGNYVEPGFFAKDKNGDPLLVTINSDLNITQTGLYTINYTAKSRGNEKTVTRKVHVLQDAYSYTGFSQEFIPKCDGYYEFSLKGAGHANGKGGLTTGSINLTKNDKLYLYIGNFSSEKNTTSFNGGPGSFDGYPGGGATDIRLFNGDWNNLDSLKSRIMVAAGAGAGNVQGSNGGGLIGDKAGISNPGTQTSPGTNEGTEYSPASFGVGGGGCGGGGGYYGGGGSLANCEGGGAGGSSFISGYAGVNAITKEFDINNNFNVTHSNNTLHFSGKYFVRNYLERNFNSGNGSAFVKYLGKEMEKTLEYTMNNVRYVKDCINGNNVNDDNAWVEMQVIKDGLNIALNKLPVGTSPEYSEELSYKYIVDGKIDNTTPTSGYGKSMLPGLQCITIDLGKEYDIDEIAIWRYFGLKFETAETMVSSDNFTWFNFNTEIAGKIEDSDGSRVNVRRE